MSFIQQKIAEEQGTFWLSLFLTLGVTLAFCLAGFFAFCIFRMNKTHNILWGFPVLAYFILILWALLTGKMD